MSNMRYVKRSRSGRGWDVVKEGHIRATAHGATKREAIREAEKAVRREGGGEVRVLNRTGKITAEDTVRPRRRRNGGSS